MPVNAPARGIRYLKPDERIPLKQLYKIPADAIIVSPSEAFETKIAAAPASATIFFQPGLYRLTKPITPLSNQTFIGSVADNGALLSKLVGTIELLEFERVTIDNVGYWKAVNLKYWLPNSGNCQTGYEGNAFGNVLYINGEPLNRCLALTDLAAKGLGWWYFDDQTDSLYVNFEELQNPSGKTIELSVVPYCFKASEKVVSRLVGIHALDIGYFGTRAQQGMIQSSFLSPSWIVEHCYLHHSHGGGITMGEDWAVSFNRILYNGQRGYGGPKCDKAVFRYNEVAYNNTLKYSVGWEAGAGKISGAWRVVLADNWVHHNYGCGMWTDIKNVDITYSNNVCEYNEELAGIFHEISYKALITKNRCRYNGEKKPIWAYGAQILLGTSKDVSVVDNECVVGLKGTGITACWQNRIGDQGGIDYEVTGCEISRNLVTYEGSNGLTGFFTDQPTLAEPMIWEKNQMEYNTYYYSTPDKKTTSWKGSKTLAEAQAAGAEAFSVAAAADPQSIYPWEYGWVNGYLQPLQAIKEENVPTPPPPVPDPIPDPLPPDPTPDPTPDPPVPDPPAPDPIPDPIPDPLPVDPDPNPPTPPTPPIPVIPEIGDIELIRVGNASVLLGQTAKGRTYYSVWSDDAKLFGPWLPL